MSACAERPLLWSSLLLGALSCGGSSGTSPQRPHLVFTAQPTATAAGQPIRPAVTVSAEDASGHIVTEFSDPVTISLESGPGRATLSGTLTVMANAGVATFSDLVLDSTGAGYTLVASAGGSFATSEAFDVGSTGILYHGGPLIEAPKVAALYWSSAVIYRGGPLPGTSGSPSADQSLIAFFLNHLAGSAYFNIVTTYFDASDTAVQNVVRYTQYWADSVLTTSTPSDTAIGNEIENGFANGKLTYDPGTIYLVFTGSGVNPGGGFPLSYCAYHRWFVDALGRRVVYAALPYANDVPATSVQSGCNFVNVFGSANDDSAADAEVDLIAHEVAEAITDATYSAWYATNGAEMADLCESEVGTTTKAANGATVNELLGGKSFITQTLWANAVNATGQAVGCQSSWASASERRQRVQHEEVATRAVPRSDPHVMRPFKISRR